jgi:hypothetical protein
MFSLSQYVTAKGVGKKHSIWHVQTITSHPWCETAKSFLYINLAAVPLQRKAINSSRRCKMKNDTSVTKNRIAMRTLRVII